MAHRVKIEPSLLDGSSSSTNSGRSISEAGSRLWKGVTFDRRVGFGRSGELSDNSITPGSFG
jgi:hypothetical protein